MKLKQCRNWYGDNESYIHLKWGNMRKWTNFTREFKKAYPKFVRRYNKYADKATEDNYREKIFELLCMIENQNIKVGLYDNYTDTPYRDTAEVWRYFMGYWLSQDKHSREHGND